VLASGKNWRMAPRPLVTIATGTLVGYAASRTMDVATTFVYERQSDESKRREEEIAPGGAPLQTVKRLGRALGRELDDEQAEQAALVFHRSLGIGFGVVSAALVRRGARPMPTALALATAAFVFVDEGASITNATRYPLVSHLRGVVGHATLGITAGALLTVVARRW
jgi:hypothetical protein